MTDSNMLITIFLEAAHHASILPMASEAAIFALKSFGGAPMLLPVLVAIAGGLAGHLFNWWVGKMLMKLPSSPKNQKMFQTLSEHFNRYGFLVLVFIWIPLGNVLVVAAGMLATPLKKVVPALLIGLLATYGGLLQ